MKVYHEAQLSSYCAAISALRIARKINPELYWSISNVNTDEFKWKITGIFRI